MDVGMTFSWGGSYAEDCIRSSINNENEGGSLLLCAAEILQLTFTSGEYIMVEG